MSFMRNFRKEHKEERETHLNNPVTQLILQNKKIHKSHDIKKYFIPSKNRPNISTHSDNEKRLRIRRKERAWWSNLKKMGGSHKILIYDGFY